MNDGSPLYRARFQWQPTTTAHDPDNVLTLEDGVAAQTYTFTGDIAITFAIAADVDFGDTQATEVALTLAVASPQTATYAEPVDVALSFGVAALGAATFAIPGDVALSFGVSSAFQYVSGTVVVEPPVVVAPPVFGGGILRPPLKANPVPVVFEIVGRATFNLMVASPVAFAHASQGNASFERMKPRSSRQFVNVPGPVEPLSEREQLVLAGVA